MNSKASSETPAPNAKATKTKSAGKSSGASDNAASNALATSRRAARETALRTLYTMDVGKQDAAIVTDESLAAAELDEKSAEFTRALIAQTHERQNEIDAAIDKFAVGFPVARQTAVDRNILRLAAAEILFQASDAPPGAVVNEAVELAKKYSTGESGKFVNGVLGALVRDLEAQQGDATTTPSSAADSDITDSKETTADA